MQAAPSEAGTGLLQEHQLLGRRLAAQDGVAVRIAPEAVDDGLVPQFVVMRALGRPRLHQRFAHRMDGGGLAVHVGHVEEGTPLGRQLRVDWAPPSLFDPPNLCGPEEGLWLEVKVAYQFRAPDVRHTGYGGQWRTNVVTDLRKMEAEPLIREAGLVLIVFNESTAILEKDLDLFETVLAQKEVLAGFRQVRSVGILDRMGHRVCTAAVWPTLQR